MGLLYIWWVEILRLGFGFMNFKVKLFCFNAGLRNYVFLDFCLQGGSFRSFH